jgi:hypothetical protein
LALWRSDAPFEPSDGSAIAPSLAAALPHIAVHGVTLTEIPAKAPANPARLDAIPSEFAVRAAQLPAVAADPSIQPVTHASTSAHVAALISHLAARGIAWSGTGRLSHCAHCKQAAQCQRQEAAANCSRENHLRPPFGLHQALVPVDKTRA